MAGSGKEKGNAIERLWSELERVRSGANWEQKLLAASYVHHRDGYEGSHVRRRETHDSSAVDYLNTFLSGFVGYMMPQDDVWAELVPMASVGKGREARYMDISELDAEPGVLEFGEKCVGAVMMVYGNAGYYPEVRMAAKDYLVMGTGYLMACDGGERGGVYYRSFDPQEVCIAEDEKRRVNVFVRRFTMDARDVVRAYPGKEWRNLRAAIKSGDGEKSRCECYEAIFPRGYLEGREDGLIGFDDGVGAYVHVMYVKEEGELAFEGEYEEFPVACIRRNRDNVKTPYGIGLVEECLPVIIELDDMGRLRQVMRQKNADPPMVVPYQLEGSFSTRPGYRNYVSDMAQRPMPVVDQYNASEMLADIQDLRDQLRSLMGADLFRTVMASTDSRKTAYEVSERKNEAMTLLQMQIGTFKMEGVEPVFRRTLLLLWRKGVIRTDGEKGLRGRNGEAFSFTRFVASCSLELNSVFVRRVEAYLQYQQNLQVLQIMGTLQQIMPSAMLNVKENQWTRDILYGAGMPKRDVRPLKEVEKKQAEWAKQQQDAVNAERLNELSGARKNLAEAAGGAAV